jgi:hypothetical protein
MSFYTSQVNTKLIDPNVYVSNLRVEFQLPKGDYGNRMRLMNVGLTAANTPKYNTYLGALASIKSVRLLNGRDELDACRECNRYLSFKRFNNSDAKNLGLGQQQMKNQYGLCVSGVGTGADAANAIVVKQTPMDLGGDAKLQLTTLEATTPKAYLDLRDCLPILSSLEVLPGDMFSQLRLVIEYETDVRNMISVDNEAVTTTRPLLACDVIEDADMVKQMMGELNGASWDAVEHDLTRIAANNADSLQQNVNRLNGFNNKRMMRFFVQKCPTNKARNVGAANAVKDGGDLISQALINEKFNVKINGRPKVSRNGAETPNQRLSYLVDAYGECNSYYGANRIGADQGSTITAGVLDGAKNDWYGLYVNDTIKDFELEITRTTKANTKTAPFDNPESDGFDVHVFADIRKQLLVNGNNYQVTYA